MKKALGQTVRDLKREVNKKVLKIPGIEQKILDATSNESWGPHGSLLADIAQATRNYHEYQIIMTVLWKRISDTGKNWRHVYKALTVLEYLVGHGSERVIDEIREHSYQISTLSDFQYIDSSGRDQGNNVRRKSQSLVSLVNDKERIQELRQKAFANKDKYRPSSATGGMYRPGSGGGGYGDRYDDDRYEGRYRDEDRDGDGRDRDGGYRDDDRYGRGGDPYNRDGDQYGRDPEDRYSRESYRDDDYKGNQFGPRTRSFDGDKERSYEDDDRYSSRNGGGRAEDHPQDEGRLERKLSEQDISAPPSYEETIGNARNHSQDESDGGTVVASAPKASSPPAPRASSPPGSASQYQSTAAAAAFASVSASPTNKEVNGFDEFDPRGSAAPAPQAPANASDMDLFGSLSDINTLALVPVTSENETSGAHVSANSGFDNNFVSLSAASTTLNQPDEDPWGGNPFKATPQDNFTAQPQSFAPPPFPPAGTSGSSGTHPQIAPQVDPVSQFGFGDSLHGLTYTPPNVTDTILPQATSQPFPPQMPAAQPNGDILVNILPPSGPSGFVAQQPPPTVAPMISQQSHPVAPMSSQQTHSQAALPDLLQQSGPSAPLSSLASLSAPNGLPAKTQTSNDKFETKSTVWADTLNRGLVNLNISGPKINPLADIGIDFDAINRKEKRQEKASAATSTVTSTVTMGKAMGSGSGIGRAGASVLAAAPPNPMMGGGMGMGSMGVGGGMGMGSMGVGGGMGMGMGGYGGGMNQQPMGMGMGMGMGMNMGVGMGMMGQGAPMRPPVGMPPTGPGMPGAYNHPMMGMGGYSSQQPYGGYR